MDKQRLHWPPATHKQQLELLSSDEGNPQSQTKTEVIGIQLGHLLTTIRADDEDLGKAKKVRILELTDEQMSRHKAYSRRRKKLDRANFDCLADLNTLFKKTAGDKTLIATQMGLATGNNCLITDDCFKYHNRFLSSFGITFYLTKWW